MNKRKLATTANGVELSKTKCQRSKIPRKRRTHISPIILCNIFTASKASLMRNLSFNSTCDEVSCNTTIESAILPLTASFRSATKKLLSKPLKKTDDVVEISVSENSCVESCSVAEESKRNAIVASEFSTVQHSPANTTATVDQNIVQVSGDFVSSDLACSEHFPFDDCEVSSATNFSEVQSDIFSGNAVSDLDDFTDEYTPSMWFNSYSGSQFSEKSEDDSTPSPCYTLFKELSKQFSKLTADNPDYEVSSVFNVQCSDELAYCRFEGDENEENYRRLRGRERNRATKAKDYTEDYEFATDYGGLITELRLQMVNWIIELSREKDLQGETMFLGVRLLDRFLSKGFFTSRKNLQLLGIACLTLAIRIEENQPYNSVRQNSFYVGGNLYSRYEVVAMEWVVLEVLKFHCCSPTIYTFLWFYLRAAEADEEMQRQAKYLAGLSLLDHRHLRFWPSTVAAALVILVSVAANRDESSLRVMRAHVRTKVDELPECIKSLDWLLNYHW